MDLYTLQLIYYSVGIVFMALVFLGILIIIILTIYILIKITKIRNQVQTIVTGFKKDPSGKATELLLSVGGNIASGGAKKIHDKIDKKGNK